MADALSAVNVQDLAGDEAGTFKVQRRIDNIAHLAYASNLMQLGQEFEVMCFRFMHRRLDRARCHSADTDTLACVVDCERLRCRARAAFMSDAGPDGTILTACSSRLVVILHDVVSIHLAALVIWKRPLRLIAKMLA